MKTFEFEDVHVDIYGDSSVTRQAAEKYMNFAKERALKDAELESVSVYVKGDSADVSANYRQPSKFERIRRITGYLTGTTDRWNGAKQAELADRVKHI